MRIAMIGTGYVGLVSGACFSEFGIDVVCVDNVPDKIDSLNKGSIPIYEPGLDDLVAKNVAAGRLSFTENLVEAVTNADAIFIAVGTPSRRGDGHADLSYVYNAAREVAQAMNGYTVIVTKSTVPVGTGDEVEEIIRQKKHRSLPQNVHHRRVWIECRFEFGRARLHRRFQLAGTAWFYGAVLRIRRIARSANLEPRSR